MQRSRKSSVQAFRSRLKRQGVVRVEVRVRRQDAALVRSVAQALGDPKRDVETRNLLKARFAAPPPTGLKALLAAAPLEGIDLERPNDLGRPVDL
jgi:hypothetical protein